MDIQKRSTGFGAAIILFAVLLRLACSGLAASAYARRPEEVPDIRLPAVALSAVQATSPTQIPVETTQSAPVTTAPTLTTSPVIEPVAGLCFTSQDLTYVRLRSGTDCGYAPQAEPLLLKSLSWELCGEAPTVLIYHSHACECYIQTPGEDYIQQENCRTLDTAYNMVAVGDALAELLETAGISVIHDRQLHDGTSYTNAYSNARVSVADYLAQYPTITLVLDLHRDAATNADGSHYATSATVDGQPAAQLMLVVGTDYGGGYHPDWQENLALALKLQVVLEQLNPGITRTTTLRGSRFNQDLSAGALIIEVGATGNTLQEALRTVPVLAQAIIELQHGANT